MPSPSPRTPANPVSLADWPTGRLLSVAAQAVEQSWHKGLAEVGLTHAGVIVLHLLSDGPLTQVELAGRARVRPQTMSRTVDTLVASGFVVRAASATDRRRRMVELTPAGRDTLAATWALESRLFPDITGVGELRRALLQIIRDVG